MSTGVLERTPPAGSSAGSGPAPAGGSGGGHRADIQGLRALAVVLVVAFHADAPLPGGFVGVDVFFVISGFVITRLLWRELERTGRIGLREFYARRVRRLLPALALVLVVVASASLVLQNPLGLQQQTARVGTGAALFAANVALLGEGGYFATPAAAMPLLHTWTLAVEEQFYLFFPFVLVVAWRLGRRSRRVSPRVAVVVAVVAVLLGSFAAGVVLTGATGGPLGVSLNRSLAFYGSPFRAWEFAIGALLAVSETAVARLPRRLAAAGGALGLGLVLYAGFGLTEHTPFPGTAALLPTVGAGLLVVAGTVGRSGLMAVFRARPVTWLGDLSYGWYLWHWPAIVFTRAVWPRATPWLLLLAGVLSLGPAWASYRLLENRIRRNRRITGGRVVALAVTCCAVPALLFAAVGVATRYPAPEFRRLQAQLRPHADVVRGCLGNLPGEARTTGACTWKAPAGAGRVLLLGDSNAGHFIEPVVAAGNGEGYDVTVATLGSCPLVELTLRYDKPYDEAACRRFVDGWLDSLRREPPALVVVANSLSYLSEGNGVSFESRDGRDRSATAAGKARLWEAGVRGALERVSAAGVPVVLVHGVPHFKVDLRTCPAFRLRLAPENCVRRADRRDVERAVAPAHAAERRAVAGVPHAVGLSLIDDICDAEHCSTVRRDGSWLYRDNAHLSVPGSLELTPRFTAAVRAGLREHSEQG